MTSAPPPDFGASLSGGGLRRAPQPAARYKLPSAVLSQLSALTIRPDRPLLIVDVDEVVLGMGAHLARWLDGRGWRLDLTTYRLDGAMRRRSDDHVADKSETSALIDRFFAEEASRQDLVPGAADALAALSLRAEILFLTNVPGHAAAARRARLTELGAPYPMVVNSGGKGRALRWLWDRTSGPAAFIDDSASQIMSAARHAPDVRRVHFVGDPDLKVLAGVCPDADSRPHDWPAATAALTPMLTL